MDNILDPSKVAKIVWNSDLSPKHQWEVIQDYLMRKIYSDCNLDDPLLHNHYTVGGRRSGRTARLLIHVILQQILNSEEPAIIVAKTERYAQDMRYQFMELLSKFNHNANVQFTSINNQGIEGKKEVLFDHTCLEDPEFQICCDPYTERYPATIFRNGKRIGKTFVILSENTKEFLQETSVNR